MQENFTSSFKKGFSSNRWLILAVVFGSVLLLVRTGWQQRQLTNAFRQACTLEKELDLRGIVASSSYDKGNPPSLNIVFSDGSSFKPVNSSGWKKITLSAGDSIRKKTGSFAITLIPVSGKPVVIDDSVVCNEAYLR